MAENTAQAKAFYAQALQELRDFGDVIAVASTDILYFIAELVAQRRQEIQRGDPVRQRLGPHGSTDEAQYLQRVARLVNEQLETQERARPAPGLAPRNQRSSDLLLEASMALQRVTGVTTAGDNPQPKDSPWNKQKTTASNNDNVHSSAIPGHYTQSNIAHNLHQSVLPQNRAQNAPSGGRAAPPVPTGPRRTLPAEVARLPLQPHRIAVLPQVLQGPFRQPATGFGPQSVRLNSRPGPQNVLQNPHGRGRAASTAPMQPHYALPRQGSEAAQGQQAVPRSTMPSRAQLEQFRGPPARSMRPTNTPDSRATARITPRASAEQLRTVRDSAAQRHGEIRTEQTQRTIFTQPATSTEPLGPALQYGARFGTLPPTIPLPQASVQSQAPTLRQRPSYADMTASSSDIQPVTTSSGGQLNALGTAPPVSGMLKLSLHNQQVGPQASFPVDPKQPQSVKLCGLPSSIQIRDITSRINCGALHSLVLRLERLVTNQSTALITFKDPSALDVFLAANAEAYSALSRPHGGPLSSQSAPITLGGLPAGLYHRMMTIKVTDISSSVLNSSPDFRVQDLPPIPKAYLVIVSPSQIAVPLHRQLQPQPGAAGPTDGVDRYLTMMDDPECATRRLQLTKIKLFKSISPLQFQQDIYDALAYILFHSAQAGLVPGIATSYNTSVVADIPRMCVEEVRPLNLGEATIVVASVELAFLLKEFLTRNGAVDAPRHLPGHGSNAGPRPLAVGADGRGRGGGGIRGRGGFPRGSYSDRKRMEEEKAKADDEKYQRIWQISDEEKQALWKAGRYKNAGVKFVRDWCQPRMGQAE